MGRHIKNGISYGGTVNDANMVKYKNGTVASELDELNTNINIRYNAETDKIQVLINGEWLDCINANTQSVTLYDYGAENVEITNGWAIENSQAYAPGNTSKTANALRVCGGGSGSYGGCISTLKKIDLTPYSKLYVESSHSGSNKGFIFCSVDRRDAWAATRKSWTITSNIDVFDISDVNMTGFIGVTAPTGGSADSYFYKIRLEKAEKTYLYKDGEQVVPWEECDYGKNGTYSKNKGVFSFDNNAITVSTSSTGSLYAITENAVDLSEYSKIRMVGTIANQQYNVTLDISGVSGSQYIAVGKLFDGSKSLVDICCLSSKPNNHLEESGLITKGAYLNTTNGNYPNYINQVWLEK